MWCFAHRELSRKTLCLILIGDCLTYSRIETAMINLLTNLYLK